MSLPLAAEGARPWRWLLGLTAVLALAASVVLAASFGEMPIAPLTSLQAIANGLGLGPYPVERIVQGIVWEYRFSRALWRPAAAPAWRSRVPSSRRCCATPWLNPMCWGCRQEPPPVRCW